MIQNQAIVYFSEVVGTGSLRKAAENLLITPSAISRQIAQLEDELGAPLFYRSSRGMVPTDAGNALLHFVEENSASILRLRATIDGLGNLSRGSVRLAVVEATTSDFLPRLLAEFSGKHPNIRFEVRVCGTHEIADHVSADRADIGLAFNVLSRDDLTLQSRMTQPLHIICRPGHPLTTNKAMSIGQLGDTPVALPARSFGIRYLVDQAADREKVTLNVRYEADSLQLIKNIVCASDVVGFMPPLTFENERSTGVLSSIHLSDMQSERSSLDIVTSRYRSLPAAAHAFLSGILARIKEI
ncbi:MULTISPECIES: LysR family transcriptional regulator [unclassified Bradyrhizobium]|uniref:LysR family transcriptional regulator n=1 Tax=unclassified Bradyrhizobium TaxID=2631580 RepID=UPI001FF94DC6|nr:LysR family transcriptional regulator [Bradyrhizobium sp. 15]MCK1614395.1 LysR family transcriptional regulator [Bradyrhizobium sp. 163]MCK1764504.1 LysR family transcriptional regulator [Bradyrhizobium sp. 136]